MKDAAQIPGVAREEGVFPTSQLAWIALLGLRGRKERGWDSSAGASISQARHGQAQSIVPCHLPMPATRGESPPVVGVARAAPGLPVPCWKVFWQKAGIKG